MYATNNRWLLSITLLTEVITSDAQFLSLCLMMSSLDCHFNIIVTSSWWWLPFYRDGHFIRMIILSCHNVVVWCHIVISSPGGHFDMTWLLIIVMMTWRLMIAILSCWHDTSSFRCDDMTSSDRHNDTPHECHFVIMTWHLIVISS